MQRLHAPLRGGPAPCSARRGAGDTHCTSPRGSATRSGPAPWPHLASGSSAAPWSGLALRSGPVPWLGLAPLGHDLPPYQRLSLVRTCFAVRTCPLAGTCIPPSRPASISEAQPGHDLPPYERLPLVRTCTLHCKPYTVDPAPLALMPVVAGLPLSSVRISTHGIRTALPPPPHQAHAAPRTAATATGPGPATRARARARAASGSGAEGFTARPNSTRREAAGAET